MHPWATDAVFYHIYPLGMCGAPPHNDRRSPPEPRLAQLHAWVDHLRNLGVNALYLGPVFEASTHGYDTADYLTVDRRLGVNDTLIALVNHLHAEGIRVILDGVFHHVGRDFPAFRDLQAHGEHSRYRDWFAGVNFGRRSPYGDAFAYDGWNGHSSLVKLNLQHADVRAYLFGVVQHWVATFGIDGLRLDAADVMELGFLRDLAGVCRRLRPDFWLLGEVIHGDYRRWANPETLDATTNYEVYKGLYSSHNDRNYFEIAYSLNRQFGPEGIYRGLPLYAFADNHDVNRVASMLRNPAHLYPLYALLLTMPGVPAIYYGSEWGVGGVKRHGDDSPLRPALGAPVNPEVMPHPHLATAIRRFAQLRHTRRALHAGDYRQLAVDHERLAFVRQAGEDMVIVAVSAATTPTRLDLTVALPDGTVLRDLLDPQARFTVARGRVLIDPLPACWARVLSAS